MNAQLLSLSKKFAMIVIMLVLLAGGLPWAPAPKGSASTGAILVNSPEDNLKNDGACTLREAIIAANKDAPSGSKLGECEAGSGADTILIPASLGTITLTRTDNGKEDASATGDLDILDTLTILTDGPGLVVRGEADFTDRIFHVLSGDLTLQGFTMSGGRLPGGGGGVYNLGDLHLEDMTLTANQAGMGGAIYNAPGGSLTMINSTISGNLAQADGGGIYNAGTAYLNNATLTANSADGDGDGTGAGGGVYSAGETFSMGNTILAGNQLSGPGTALDCWGAVDSRGYNLVGDTNNCSLNGETGSDLTGLDPALSPLQDNGGGTPTHAPVEGSPAIDAGNPAAPGSSPEACQAADQRGVLRPRGAACDTGAVETGQPNAPILIRAAPDGENTQVVGRLFSAPGVTFSLAFYAASVCDASLIDPVNAVGDPLPVTTDSSGDILFTGSLAQAIPVGYQVAAVATGPDGVASPASRCLRVGLGNDSWPTAARLFPGESPNMVASAIDYLDLPGGSRWYKFSVQPNSRLIVTLTGLPANYDLTLYKDIPSAYRALSTPQDLTRLDAEFAPDAFSPDAYSPDAYSPDAYSPDAYSPDAFSPDAYSPDAYSPDAYSPDAYSPDAYSPDAFSPDAYSPDAYSPDAFSPDAYSPDAYSPDAYSPDAYSSAQTRSLIAISAFDGMASEGLLVNTWSLDSDMYVRVRGRNGAFSTQAPFDLQVRLIPGSCAQVSDEFPASSLTPQAGDYRTLILADLSRMPGTEDEKTALLSLLQDFAARPEVEGAILDLSNDARISSANLQADAHPACPYAKNLVAAAIKQVVDGYWDLNPDLQYLTIVGGDQVVPFFRHPDHSLLASEKNYTPPVLDNTSSQASLKLGYVLSQDDYGARETISIKGDQLPIPGLAVGRLVETSSEAATMLGAYLGTPDGVVATPSSALVTGYDFLEDAARQVLLQLDAGMGISATEALTTPRDVSPTDSSAWSADDLRAALFGQRHDLVFLAGHFSANSALAADYSTRMLAEELAASEVNMTNTIFFSAGCHSGYNIVDQHGVPQVTREPDWAQVMARKGATLVAGTGYQYGDTDFIKYSEKLYLDFSQELRTGSGPVSVGAALVNAKRAYLSTTPYLRGIDQKAVLEATMFGLPMLSVDMPGERLPASTGDSLVASATAFEENPGAFLGLGYADLGFSPELTLESVKLTHVGTTDQYTTASYYSGPDGTVVSPNEPILPLEAYKVGMADKALRGVGFRGGSYTDLLGIYPMTGAAATEIRGVHAPFLSDIFYPVRPFAVNYFQALGPDGAAATGLSLYPAQYRSSHPGSPYGTLRRFDELQLRLFYSQNVTTYTSGGAESTPALSAPPSITQVSAPVSEGEVKFHVRIAGNPAAGIQQVWVTYTHLAAGLSGEWQSMDLKQNPNDSSLWQGSLPLGGLPPGEIAYLVQAVNGVGLVSMDSNQGRYYTPGMDNQLELASQLSFIPVEGQTEVISSGRYSQQVSFKALLSGQNGEPLAEKPVVFSLGPQSRLAVTGPDGIASVTLSIYGPPGASQLQASFAGDQDYQASSSSLPFDIHKQTTQISLAQPPSLPGVQSSALVTVTLTDVDGHRLNDETIFFVVSGPGISDYQAVITDYAGRAPLEGLSLPPGDYTIQAFFSGEVPLPEPITLDDDRYLPAVASTTINVPNLPPTCSLALANPDSLWPPDGSFTSVQILGVSDPESGPVSLTITGVFQDEPVGSEPDAIILGDTAELRSERDGNGDGRVYHVFFEAVDDLDGLCNGEVDVAVVPHDQSGNTQAIDGGALYDSTQP